MKKNLIIAAALVTLGIVATALVASEAASPLTACIGKAAWYLPYAAFVSSVKFLAR